MSLHLIWGVIVVADTLESLAASFGAAAAAIGPVAAAVVESNAGSLIDKWRSVAPWGGSTHLPNLPSQITHEMKGETEAEIGPIKGDQGSLGHIIEFGSVNSGAHPGGGPAAMAQAPIFMAELGAAAYALLAGGGVSMRTSNPSRYNAPIA
jgi:hypothetical protein